MASLCVLSATMKILNWVYIPFRKGGSNFTQQSLKFPISAKPIRVLRCKISSHLQSNGEFDEEGAVEDLRVPDDWLVQSKAFEVSEWLKVTLHKWLDDEYCPEPTNVEISKIAARSFYRSLLEKQTDLGEILLIIAKNLETISFKESFHGAFSSANAAVNLIADRIEQE